jgi:zinc transporter
MASWHLERSPDGQVRELPIANGTGEGPGFDWIHLDGRNSEQMSWLREHGSVPHHAYVALVAAETRPRSEQYAEGALVNFRGLGATPEDDPDPLVSIRMWATKGRVISVSYRTLLEIDTLKAKMQAGELHDPGDLISATAIHITHLLDPKVTDMGDTVDDCEASIDPKKAFPMRRVIGKVRSDAIAYRRFVVPERQALERLAGIDCGWLNEDDRLHLREAADRFARMGEELEAIRERSALMHEQLTDLRAELVETRTLVLAIVALVFLPLTFITGLLGMNVEGIPFAKEPWAFWGVVGVCAALAVAITGYFAKAKWFN